MADKLHKVLHKIHETDEELIRLLAKRVRYSQLFYAEEAEHKKFHADAEKGIYLRMKKIADAAELDEKFVKKFYKQITKHAKKHKHVMRKHIEKKQKELEEQKKQL